MAVIVIDPLQTTALATTFLTTQTTVNGHTQDPSRMPKLRITLLTHFDRLVARNRKNLVLPRQMGHLVLPMESPEKGLGAIGRTIMIDVWTR